jgi:hypothetical protein
VQVFFGGTPALAVTLISPTELLVVTPPGPIGPVDVTVTNPGVPPTVEPAGFVYAEMPRITPDPRGTRILTRESP